MWHRWQPVNAGRKGSALTQCLATRKRGYVTPRGSHSSVPFKCDRSGLAGRGRSRDRKAAKRGDAHIAPRHLTTLLHIGLSVNRSDFYYPGMGISPSSSRAPSPQLFTGDNLIALVIANRLPCGRVNWIGNYVASS
ncbi:hypothetical protein BaRGS_00031049 [Batillaria attramentaria]|uniref:Uncharacterized protein n=1 Tax=Batillaria attramentaria TaxID=370345 RepID=A0ABD0JRI5_9CAEN